MSILLTGIFPAPAQSMESCRCWTDVSWWNKWTNRRNERRNRGRERISQSARCSQSGRFTKSLNTFQVCLLSSSTGDNTGEREDGTGYKFQISETPEIPRYLLWPRRNQVRATVILSLRTALFLPGTGHTLFGRFSTCIYYPLWLATARHSTWHLVGSEWMSVTSLGPSGIRATERRWTRHLILRSHQSSGEHRQANECEIPC